MLLHSRATAVTLASVPPSVQKTHFFGNWKLNQHHFWGVGWGVHHTFVSPNCFFVLYIFQPATIWEQKSNGISSESEHVHVKNMFTPKNSCILLGRVATKVVQRLVKFQILNFAKFFAFVNIGPYGSQFRLWGKVLNVCNIRLTVKCSRSS